MRHHKSNAFIDLDGIPYLLGIYMDRCNFQMVDRAMIQSGIYVDTTESMRAVIDIQIDDIGKKNMDGDLNARTNKQKLQDLIEGIRQMALAGKMELPVLCNSMIARINYRLENNRTGHVIRTMSEDVRITNRSTYLDINQNNIDDQALLSNFNDTIISTINQFTHGRDMMILRVTSIRLFYEMLRPDPLTPSVRKQVAPSINQAYNCGYGSLLDYHEAVQNQHFLGDADYRGNDVTPPDWSLFERFYHFEDNGSFIALHTQEINDPRVRTILVPCGKVDVNRAFVINPGHRIIFKFSIWKNDMVLMNDTSIVAKLLRAPVLPGKYHHHHHHHHCDPYHDVLSLCSDGLQMDYNQNSVINRLNNVIADLQDRIEVIEENQAIKDDTGTDSGETDTGGNDDTGTVTPPTTGNDDEESPDYLPGIPVLPERPIDPTNPIQVLYKMVTDLTEKVDQLIEEKNPSTPTPPTTEGESTPEGETEPPVVEEEEEETVPEGESESASVSETVSMHTNVTTAMNKVAKDVNDHQDDNTPTLLDVNSKLIKSE